MDAREYPRAGGSDPIFETEDHEERNLLTTAHGLRLMAYDVQPSKRYDAGENPF